jgi:hypothetical protein
MWTSPSASPAVHARRPRPRDELPYMTLAVGDERTEVQVATWARESAEVELPTLYFLDTEEGQLARQAGSGAESAPQTL